MSGPQRTQRLLGSLRMLVRELEELTGQRPTLAELCSVGVDDSGVPRGELHLVSTASAVDVLAWCDAVHATSARCLRGDPGELSVTVTPMGRLGELPVRLLTGLPRELADQLGAEWAVWRLRELLGGFWEPQTRGVR